jgi:excisionase family DNA binding protein
MSSDISPEPDYLTIEGGASVLGVSKNQFRNMIRDGLIPAYRFSSRVIRIRRADIDAAASPVKGGESGQWKTLA